MTEASWPCFRNKKKKPVRPRSRKCHCSSFFRKSEHTTTRWTRNIKPQTLFNSRARANQPFESDRNAKKRTPLKMKENTHAPPDKHREIPSTVSVLCNLAEIRREPRGATETVAWIYKADQLFELIRCLELPEVQIHQELSKKDVSGTVPSVKQILKCSWSTCRSRSQEH